MRSLTGPPEQLVHRPAQQLPFQVPERVINGADGVAGHPMAPYGAAERRIMSHSFSVANGILPIQQLGKVIVDDRADRPAMWVNPSPHVPSSAVTTQAVRGQRSLQLRPGIS